MICEKCSCVNEDGAKFCEKCGHLLGTEPSIEKKVDLPITKKKLEPFTKVQKFGIVFAIVIVLILAGGFSFAKNYYSKENQVDRY